MVCDVGRGTQTPGSVFRQRVLDLPGRQPPPAPRSLVRRHSELDTAEASRVLVVAAGRGTRHPWWPGATRLCGQCGASQLCGWPGSPGRRGWDRRAAAPGAAAPPRTPGCGAVALSTSRRASRVAPKPAASGKALATQTGPLRFAEGANGDGCGRPWTRHWARTLSQWGPRPEPLGLGAASLRLPQLPSPASRA